MPKSEKVKVNVKERIEDDICDLSLSELNEIPVREIASFKRVTTLDLSSNRLLTLGKNFTTLTRLIKLDLSKNQIKYLPEDFGLLENLRHLDLYDNKLEHIPLSFGKLRKLRYLDLKGNPLAPAWAKIIGHCLTTKDCQDAARNAVNLCSKMKIEIAKKPNTEEIQQKSNVSEQQQQQQQQQQAQQQQLNKKSNKKNKTKQKKSTNNNDDIATIKELNTEKSLINSKNNQKRKSTTNKFGRTSGVALTSIITFLLLLAINIIIIYMMMFKNPEIADKLVESIPHQYRDWILTKTEIFRLRVTDWITEFRTPPEEH